MELAYSKLLKPIGSGLEIAKTKECSKNVYIYVFGGVSVKARVTNLQKFPKQAFFVVTWFIFYPYKTAAF